MFSIIYRTAVGVSLLLVIPVILWLLGWQWQPSGDTWWLKVFFWITETITRPWGVFTNEFLCLWFLWCLHFRVRTSIILFSIITAEILVGQGIKLLLKEYTREPRPFVIWLQKTQFTSINKFYFLEKKICNSTIEEKSLEKEKIPIYLYKHWKKEDDFAFPSGHTMFSASWALFGVGLLWPYQRIWTIFILIIWTIAIMGGRILLGMHWPIDLIVSILISWLLVIAAIWFIRKFCYSFI